MKGREEKRREGREAEMRGYMVKCVGRPLSGEGM